MGVFGGELFSVGLKTARFMPHFASKLGIRGNTPKISLICHCAKEHQHQSWCFLLEMLQPVPAEQPLNKLLPYTTKICDFLPDMGYVIVKFYLAAWMQNDQAAPLGHEGSPALI